VKVALITGALNEEIPLKEWTRQIPQGCDLYVVDDGSTDGTSSVARSLGARVIRHPMNLGQGYAFITGIKAIVRHTKEPYDYIVYLDADGQHDPREIPSFIEKAQSAGLDVVVGSRILGSNHASAPFFRRKFLPLYTSIINRLTGYRMTDSMCGFRAFRVVALREVLPVFDQMLEPQYMAAEMFIRFSRVGLKVGEVPIHMKDRLSGFSYKGFIRYGFGVLKAVARTIVDHSRR
jgi:glycosyltransferase involved in cell wall biosynthesis